MTQATPRIYEFDAFRLDAVKRLLWREGEPVPLTSKSFETLLALVEGRGEILDKDALLSRVWPDAIVEEKNLTINISALRKALGESPQEHRYILTVPGRGYRFVAEVREVTDGEPELMVRQSARVSVVEEEWESEGVGEGERKKMDDTTLTLPRSPAPPLPLSHSYKVWLAVALLAVLVIGIAFWWKEGIRNESAIGLAGGPPSAIKSLAVLPFKSLNPPSSEDYLGVGLADVTITRLSNLNQLIVRPTSSVLPFAAQDPLQAGQLLKVDAVLDGSLQQAGDRVRVTVRLLRVSDGTPLWAEKFDEPFTDILAVEDAISARVASALTHSLTGEQRRQLAKHYTENTEAWQLYLKGRYFWNKRSPAAIRQGIGCFEQAIAGDPRLALAFSGLADSYVAGILPLPQTETMPKAKAAALEALARDDSLAEAHATLGKIAHLYEWNWSSAEREFERSLALNPNYPTTHQWYAEYLLSLNRIAEARQEMKRALELDPLSLAIKLTAGRQAYYTRQYDQAIAQFRQALELDPSFTLGHRWLSLAYELKGQYAEAVEENLKATASPEKQAALRGAWETTGWPGYLRKTVEYGLAEARQTYISPFYIAATYASLGEPERAFEWFEKAYQERYQFMVHLHQEPRADSLRSDPRFADLLRRVGLTQ